MGSTRGTDADLVRAAVVGDADAFAVLYRRHVAAVHRVLSASVRDREAAADLTQEVFARAIKALPALRDPDRFRPWILAIARHAAIDAARTDPRSRSYDAEADEGPPDRDPTPAELAELDYLVQRVRGCIASLSARDATVLALVTQLGYSPAEVAQAIGITPGAAKVVLHRARRRLRSAIALTLLTENQGAACPVFRSAYQQGRLAQAGAHASSCPTCARVVNADVELFGAGTATG